MRRLGGALVLFGLLCRLSTGQYMPSKPEPEPRLVLAPPLDYVPRYRRDPKDSRRIVNPDFFCSRCAAERRIAPRTRDEMKRELTVVKEFPGKVEGKKRCVAERFRLMQEKGDHVLRYLFSELGLRHATFIEDGMFRLFVDLPGCEWRSENGRRRGEEYAQLADVFPELSRTTTRLGAHHRAHLCLIRAHRVRRDFEAFVGHDPRAAYMMFEGPFLGNFEKFELYVFRRQKHVESFVGSFVGRYPGIEGMWWHGLKDDSMVAAFSVPDARDVWVNSSLTGRLAFNLMLSYRGYRFEVPAWLLLGFAHVMERRERSDLNTYFVSGEPVPKPGRKVSWRKLVRSAVARERYPRLRSLARRRFVNEVPVTERPICWSLVSYLMQRDEKKLAATYQDIKSKGKGEATNDRQDEAFKRIWGMTLDEVEADWKAWVLKTYRR